MQYSCRNLLMQNLNLLMQKQSDMSRLWTILYDKCYGFSKKYQWLERQKKKWCVYLCVCGEVRVVENSSRIKDDKRYNK